MANTYDIGDVVRLTTAITTTATGAAVDPTGLAVILRTPAKNTTYTYGVDVEVVKDSVGNYHLDHTTTLAGRHVYRWVATGTAAAASENQFRVRVSQVTQ